MTAVAALLTTVSAPALATALLSTHVPGAVVTHQAPIIGRPDPASHMQLEIALPMRNQDALDATLRAIYDPASPLYRHYLSVAEFTERFGPTESDYAKAASFFKAAGLDVTAASPNRYLIEVDGSVAAIERIFHVKLNLYRHPTEQRSFTAPDREPTLNLAVPVLHVTGLDDFSLASPRLIAPSSPESGKGAGGSGPGGNFLGSDMRAAYYGQTALTGTGQSVGLMELEGYNVKDVDLYFTKVGQPLNVPINGISADGKTKVACNTCNDSEQVLDIEYTISMAPGLQQVQVYVARQPLAVLNRMASDNISKQLSTSWGWNENFKVEDPIYKEMAAQGQTFLTASGDYSSLKKSGPWPEEDANLTAVGGTDLVTNGAGGTYKSEKGWNGSAGGPSLDRNILIESYQLPFINEKNEGSHTLRNVPDVAANANYDMYICSNGKCNGGWAGTSFASPMWAGFVALANQQALANGKPLVGFLNPTLYVLSQGKSYNKIFHDVIGGKSGKYYAVKSFDLVTGLGSPNGQGLIDALAGTQ